MADKTIFEMAGVRHEFTPPKEMTLDQYAEITVVLEESGLDEVERFIAETTAEMAGTEEGVDSESGFGARIAQKIILRIYRARVHARLLAAFVRAPGQDWSREFAEAAEQRFLKAKGEQVHLFQEMLGQLCVAFFVNGLGSWRTSRSSSVRLAPRDPSPETGTAPTSETTTS